MPRILAVANPRPGSGKTTSTLHLGHALVELGHTVLLVDLSPTATLTTALGLDPASLEQSVRTVLRGGLVDLPAMTLRLRQKFFLLPGSPLLRDDPLGEGVASLPLDRLRAAFGAYPIPFEFLLIDTPSSLGTLTLNALVAASEVLVPTPCSPPVLAGVSELVEELSRVKEHRNSELSVLGFLATRLDSHSPESIDALAELREILSHRLLPWVVDEGPGESWAKVFRQFAAGLVELRF